MWLYLPPPSLLFSSLLCSNPSVINQWAALCKALPGTTDGGSPWTKCNVDFEAVKERPTCLPYVKVINPLMWEDVVPMDVETAPPIFALALGGGNRSDLESLYQDMLEYARYKGQHTCSVYYVHSILVCCSL